MANRIKKLTRREFTKIATAGTASLTAASSARKSRAQGTTYPIRLGGPVFSSTSDPDDWAQAHRKLGYSATLCPVNAQDPDDAVNAYARAAQKANLIIAEVGVWNNPLSTDETVRREALRKCIDQLALADRIGAKCAVNITGSRGEQWDGPDPKNLTDETFDMIVETTRAIIDEVKPKRTFYTLEMMPWAYPDSVDSYVRLLQAIDRKQFAVHIDPVNIISSPQRYYNNGELIRECFAKLGGQMKSCHAKDTIIRRTLTTHIDETIPGQGELDYATYLREISKLPDVPLILEHLETAEEYKQAADYVVSVGKGLGLTFA